MAPIVGHLSERAQLRHNIRYGMTARLRVLVVEDVPDIRRTTTLALDHAGFEVIEAATGEEAVAAVAEHVDVVLLDRGLPDVDGIALIPVIRAVEGRMHIIIVSGSGAETDRVEGLLAGADDYVVKPASMPELIARITAAGRRLERDRGEVLRFDGLTIDIERRQVVRDGRRVDLTRQEFDLLAHLARNSERAVTREELLAAAWSSSAAWQSPATVTEHVRRVRNKIEDDPTSPRRIESVRGIGYRFNADTTVVADPVAPRTPIVLIDGGSIVHASADALHLLGAGRPDQVVGRDVADFIAARSIAALGARRATAEAGQWPRPEIITLVRVDGREIHVEVSTTPVTWEGRNVRQVTLWPIEGRTERLRELVTGIGVEVPDAVIITDTDLRIESFNEAAERLYGWREDEVLGRRMMDVIPWLDDPAELAAAAVALERDHRWHGRVRQRRHDGRALDVMASTTLLSDDAGRTVGVISVNRPAPEGGRHPRGGNGHEHGIADEITGGIERGEFDVFYQPIVRLDDRATAGLEALVRWHHPTRGLLAPGAFIQAAERTGVIDELGRHVLDRGCAQLERWRRAGHDVHLSVNLSARQIADARLVERVGRAMADHDVGPGVLWLEVTESALVEDLDVATTRLEALRALGVGISIDDFGTGWASLTYLHQFPIDALKIDSVFVKGLGARASSTAIVRSIVSLGQELDIAVIAEGIETEPQLDALRSLGCTVGQGYLFAEPAAAADVRLGSLLSR
jgi:PAS domain S-box-containing protein